MKRALFLFLALSLATACSDAQVRQYALRVVKEYPHDAGAYTQGLFFDGGKLYESTGQFGISSFRTVDLMTGKALTRLDFDRKYFVEGSAMLDGILYILTWTNRVAFRYDANTLEYKGTLRYPREGWGLTTDGKQLIASDGSAKLFFMDKDLKVKREVTVKMAGRPMRHLNELEWIDGRIWANVYTTDLILIINPSDGKVEGTVDCRGLLPEKLKTRDTDVLNGIAVLDGRIFLTGKNWPRLYEVELIEKQ